MATTPILKVKSWDETGGGSYNAWETEAGFAKWTLNHEMNDVASTSIIIVDPTGTKMQKYNVDTQAIFTGPGQIMIQDPDPSDDVSNVKYYGRILKATYDNNNSLLTLYCEDWMSQLKDENITYDFRKTLRSSSWEGTVKESVLRSDLTGDDVPVWSAAGNVYTVVDAISPWAIDYFNTMFFVVPDEGTGRVTSTTGSFGETVTPDSGAIDTNTPVDGEDNVWETDLDRHIIVDNDDGFGVEHSYFLPHITGSLLDSVKAAKIEYNILFYTEYDPGWGLQRVVDTSEDCVVSLYNYTTVAWDVVHTIEGDLSPQEGTIDINTTELVDDYVDSTTGYLKIKLYCANTGPDRTSLLIDLLVVTTDFVLDPILQDIQIDDTIKGIADGGAVYNTLELDTNVAEEGLGLYEGCPYCIVDYLYLSVNELALAIDQHVTLTTSVETGTTLLARRFEDMNTLKIFQEMAKADNATFHVVLGDLTPTIVWKRVYNGAGTAFTDASVLRWTSTEYDATSIWNEIHLYGGVAGEKDIYVDSSDIVGGDPGATSKGIYGTRSIMENQPGLTSMQTGIAYAEQFVDSHTDMKLHLTATVEGMSSYVLGTELSITSTILDLAAVKYVVIGYQWDSEAHETVLTLHPQVSVGYIQPKSITSVFGDTLKSAASMAAQPNVKRPRSTFV